MGIFDGSVKDGVNDTIWLIKLFIWPFMLIVHGFKHGWMWLATGIIAAMIIGSMGLPWFVSDILRPAVIAVGVVLMMRKMKKNRAAKQAVIDAQNQITNPDPSPILQSESRHGVFFGRHANKFVIKPEALDGHILTVGGVGSGKSSCIAIPTLRAWKEAVFAIDIKGELYENTKANRPNIHVFNPFDPDSYGYDPFYTLRHSDNKPQEASAIAQALIPLPPNVRDPYWIESAQSILTGAILHFSALDFSFIETIEAIQSTPPQLLIETIYSSEAERAKLFVASFVGIAETTLASITSELSRSIIAFATDENLISGLSRKRNITPEDLENGADIYINIPEHLLRQWKSLLTLMVNQFLNYFEKRPENDAKPILFLLDEFPRLGKIDAMLDGLATLRSKKITIALIIQSLAQLDAIYGTNERKVISDTCAYKAILNATDADTQDYFSKLIGTYDKEKKSHSISHEAYTGLPKGTSDSTGEHEKRIIKPEEFATLGDIVLLTPFGFTRVEKEPYYAEQALKVDALPQNMMKSKKNRFPKWIKVTLIIIVVGLLLDLIVIVLAYFFTLRR